MVPGHRIKRSARDCRSRASSSEKRPSSRANTTSRCTQQIGEEQIGEIVDGVPDKGVRVGLLGEWKRVLDA
jgi:hypothetical protein